MALYTILYYPDQRLRISSERITVFDAALHTLIEDMFETMYAARGIGLAAPQIGINKQLVVIDITRNQSNPWCFINPEITKGPEQTLTEEGCLSIPGVYGKTPRALQVHLTALDRAGQPYTLEAEGLLAHCIQHEFDHLQGKLFIDYLSPLKQQLALRKLDKFKRKTK